MQKIKQLNAELEGEQQKQTLLSNQFKKIEDDVKASKRKVETSQKEKQMMEVKIHELNLDNDSASRSLKNILLMTHARFW